jgi:hypothetical protein
MVWTALPLLFVATATQMCCGATANCPLQASMRASPDACALAEARWGGHGKPQWCQMANGRTPQQTPLRLRGGATRKKEAQRVLEKSEKRRRAIPAGGLEGSQQDKANESDEEDEEGQDEEDGSAGDEEEEKREEDVWTDDDEEGQGGEDGSARKRTFSKIGTMAVSV